jgi:hypothetical protein
MRLSCILGRHDVAPKAVENQGFAFSRCRCCGRDMVRSRRDWTPVPKGFRVVWRRPAAPREEIGGAQLLLDLPAAGRALALRRMPERRRGRASVLLDLLAAGLRYLAWAAGGRLRAWCKALLAPRKPDRPLLGLPAR